MFKRFLIIPAVALLLASCSDSPKEEPIPEPEPVSQKMTVLCYVVASEPGMTRNFESDKKEMLLAAPQLDLEHNNYLLYSTINASKKVYPSLSILTQNPDGTFEFKTLLTWDRSQYSTDPERLKEVLFFMQEEYAADNYGFILAGHGSGWSPEYSDHIVTRFIPTLDGAIGGDTNYNPDAPNGDQITYDWLDIDELRDILPDNLFSFIWMDACYMANVEVMYELRDKADYFVGYVTEIYIEGAPYDEILPDLVKENPDVKSAAEKTFNWYNDNSRAVTITVADMKKLPALAEATKVVMENYEPLESASGLQNYARGKNGPFYDLLQYTNKIGANSGKDEATMKRFHDALDDATVYAAASARNFNGYLISQDDYSGFSCHFYTSYTSDYYRELGWYKAVYSPLAP